MAEQTHKNVLYVKCNKKEDAKFLFLFRYSQSPLGTQPLSPSLPSWESQRGNRNIESGRRRGRGTNMRHWKRRRVSGIRFAKRELGEKKY